MGARFLEASPREPFVRRSKFTIRPSRLALAELSSASRKLLLMVQSHRLQHQCVHRGLGISVGTTVTSAITRSSGEMQVSAFPSSPSAACSERPSSPGTSWTDHGIARGSEKYLLSCDLSRTFSNVALPGQGRGSQELAGSPLSFLRPVGQRPCLQALMDAPVTV